MASVSVRKETNTLYLDFRYIGKRCREQTPLKATIVNKRKLEKLLTQIESEIIAGTFRYAIRFPESKMSDHFSDAVFFKVVGTLYLNFKLHFLFLFQTAYLGSV